MISCHTLLKSDVIASKGKAPGRVSGCGGVRGYQLSTCWECKSELMKLPRALFSYTKKLMTSFLAGHSVPGGAAISKLAQVCVVSENMVHGRGQSLALSWQLLKIGFRWRTHSAHSCWSLLGWHGADTTLQRGWQPRDINKKMYWIWIQTPLRRLAKKIQ